MMLSCIFGFLCGIQEGAARCGVAGVAAASSLEHLEEAEGPTGPGRLGFGSGGSSCHYGRQLSARGPEGRDPKSGGHRPWPRVAATESSEQRHGQRAVKDVLAAGGGAGAGAGGASIARAALAERQAGLPAGPGEQGKESRCRSLEGTRAAVSNLGCWLQRCIGWPPPWRLTRDPRWRDAGDLKARGL